MADALSDAAAIAQADLYGFHADNDSTRPSQADYRIPGDDWTGSISKRANDLIDSAKFDVADKGGDYSRQVLPGDRIQLHIAAGLSGGSTGDNRYSETRYAEATYSPTARPQRRWTGLVTDREPEVVAPGLYALKIEAADFVFGILADRRHVENYIDKPLGGSSDAILNDAITQQAPEIDVSGVEDVGARTDMKVNGRYLLDILRDCLARGDAFAYQDGTTLHFVDPEGVASLFELSPGSGDWHRPSFSVNTDNLYNRVRIIGSKSGEADDVNETQSSYQTATTTNRITAQVNTRKSELTEVEIWTRTTGSQEDVTVRLQKDSGGAPIAPADSKSDIVRKTLSHEFLDNDGWTSFQMPDHTLPEPNPWIIVETEGDTGQDIGVDGSGRLSYRTYFPFPVAIRSENLQSQKQYRRRDDWVEKESIRTAQEAQDFGDGYVRHRSEPEQEVQFFANSSRTSSLDTGDLIDVSYPDLGISGTYVVTAREDAYKGRYLDTTLTARDLDTL